MDFEILKNIAGLGNLAAIGLLTMSVKTGFRLGHGRLSAFFFNVKYALRSSFTTSMTVIVKIISRALKRQVSLSLVPLNDFVCLLPSLGS